MGSLPPGERTNTTMPMTAQTVKIANRANGEDGLTPRPRAIAARSHLHAFTPRSFGFERRLSNHNVVSLAVDARGRVCAATNGDGWVSVRADRMERVNISIAL